MIFSLEVGVQLIISLSMAKQTAIFFQSFGAMAGIHSAVYAGFAKWRVCPAMRQRPRKVRTSGLKHKFYGKKTDFI